jgi:glycosyltransferase involved in cell wall biosynthesis
VPLSLPKEGPLRLRFVGALIPTKGPHIILAAIKTIPKEYSYELQLIGPELPYNGRMDYLTTLKQTAQAMNIPIRSCQPKDMPAVWAETDVFLFPSLWEENSPSVLREAAAAGIPILSSDLKATREICREATLIAPNESHGWGQALRTEIQRGRRRCMPQQFPHIQMHARQVIRYYEDILKHR